MAYAAWKGSISFGLVNIPVVLRYAESLDKLHFHWLDKSDMSRIKYQMVNANTEKEVPKATRIMGIAKIVIQNRQHICALIAKGDLIWLEILRYAHEIKKPAKSALTKIKDYSLKESEVRMAEKLIGEMAEEWRPEQLKDEYQNNLRAFINKKLKHGDKRIGHPLDEKRVTERNSNVVDFMSLLKKSVKKASHEKHKAPHVS